MTQAKKITCTAETRKRNGYEKVEIYTGPKLNNNNKTKNKRVQTTMMNQSLFFIEKYLPLYLET